MSEVVTSVPFLPPFRLTLAPSHVHVLLVSTVMSVRQTKTSVHQTLAVRVFAT